MLLFIELQPLVSVILLLHNKILKFNIIISIPTLNTLQLNIPNIEDNILHFAPISLLNNFHPLFLIFGHPSQIYQRLKVLWIELVEGGQGLGLVLGWGGEVRGVDYALQGVRHEQVMLFGECVGVVHDQLGHAWEQEVFLADLLFV